MSEGSAAWWSVFRHDVITARHLGVFALTVGAMSLSGYLYLAVPWLYVKEGVFEQLTHLVLAVGVYATVKGWRRLRKDGLQVAQAVILALYLGDEIDWGFVFIEPIAPQVRGALGDPEVLSLHNLPLGYELFMVGTLLAYMLLPLRRALDGRPATVPMALVAVLFGVPIGMEIAMALVSAQVDPSVAEQYMQELAELVVAGVMTRVVWVNALGGGAQGDAP